MRRHRQAVFSRALRGARTPVLLEVAVRAARGDEARGVVHDREVALEGDVSGVHVQARAHRLERAAAAVAPPRVIAQQRQVRGVAAAGQARRHGIEQAVDTRGSKCVKRARARRLQRRALAERRHGYVTQAVDEQHNDARARHAPQTAC